jgi:hypothetical protein
MSSVYTVRKDNSISFKGNLYSLPLGTYQGRGSAVCLQVDGDLLIVLDDKGQGELCRHRVATGKGQKILNSDHKRDKSSAIGEMMGQLASQMPDPQKARDWFELIKKEKPRYVRDQLLIVRETVETIDLELTARVLQYCLDNKITSAMDFKAIAAHYMHQQEDKETTKGKIVPLNPLSGKFPDAAYRKPDKSSLDDYLSIINDK